MQGAGCGVRGAGCGVRGAGCRVPHHVQYSRQSHYLTSVLESNTMLQSYRVGKNDCPPVPYSTTDKKAFNAKLEILKNRKILAGAPEP